MATRVLIINRQLVFAVTLKQALEQTGVYDVHPFTTADAAFDFLRDHPQDVALVDFTLPGRSGVKIIQQLRAIQQDLIVIISPRQPDADALMSSLRLQGMIDMPFGARDVIPLIERAIEGGGEVGNAAPPPAQTRVLGDVPEQPGQATTKPLAEDDHLVRRQFGTTRLFDHDAETAGDQPEAPIPSDANQSPIKPLRSEPKNASPIKPLSNAGQTRDLDTPDDAPRIKPLRRDSHQTRDLDSNAPPPPAVPPEVSSLESVLQSFGFDPPVSEEDTPSVPVSDSDALRQFLATGDRQTEGGNPFDDVLDAIDPDAVDEMSRRDAAFDGLVRSMRSDEQYRTLPDRQQNLMDFIITSGMDAVLREIEKTKPGSEPEPPPPTTLPEPPPEQAARPKGNFQKLANEEPPPPTFEESGTVGDLMLGVSDTGFRNVLSLLRGNEVDVTGAETDERERFADFFAPPPQQPAAALPKTPPQNTESRPDRYRFDDYLTDEEAEEATVAQVILQAALQDVQLSEGFSLNQLLTDIENRLSLHHLSVKPLPSWQMDTGVFRPVTETEIQEPDFLPEEFTTGELISPHASLEFDEPESYTGRTTRPSASNQQLLDSFTDEQDTLFDSRFVEEATAQKADASEIFGIDEGHDFSIGANQQTGTPIEEETQPPDTLLDESIPTSAFMDGGDLFYGEAPPDVPELPEAGSASFLAPLLEGSASSPEARPAETPDEWEVQDEASEADWALPPREPDVWEQPEAFTPSDEPDAAADAWELSVSEDTSTPDESSFSPPDLADTGEAWEQTPVEAEVPVPEDPYIAQMALNLTQFSMESSSEASVLTRDGDIVAFAGHLSTEELQELREVIGDDWAANDEGARIRFITLPASGKDYMLYSIATEGDLTLSMVFAGTTPLRVIRQQGQRLMEALDSLPELVEEAITPPPAELIPADVVVDESLLNHYSYAWVLRDPDARLSDSVAQAVVAGLTTQLRELGWKVHALQVYEDFIYLYAGVPGESPSHEIVRDLKRRSAEIAHTQNPDLTPQMLWADAYLILAPGRELQTEEILEFINFQRMA